MVCIKREMFKKAVVIFYNVIKHQVLCYILVFLVLKIFTLKWIIEKQIYRYTDFFGSLLKNINNKKKICNYLERQHITINTIIQ